MRVLVVHSDVGADARPDDLDTLTSAEAVADALRAQGHIAALAPFAASPEAVRKILEIFRADAVFNMVESVFGQDSLAALAPSIFERIGVPYTGNASVPIAVTGDKPLAKRLMRAAGFPRPTGASRRPGTASTMRRPTSSNRPPRTHRSASTMARWCMGRKAVIARAQRSAKLHHGRWFAEAYIEGREFNVALLEGQGGMRALPVPEMRFQDWPARQAAHRWLQRQMG